MQTQIPNIAACLALAVVLGTDVFFTLVGRTALAATSSAGVLEVMGNLHAVADRRMPLFGVTGLLCTALVAALQPQNRLLAVVSLASQLGWLALYFTIAKPINTQLTASVRTGEACDVRALQARWESILIARSALLAMAECALLVALTRG